MQYFLPSGADPDVELMLRLKNGEDHILNELMTRWQQPLVAFRDLETAVQSKNLHAIHDPSMKIRALPGSRELVTSERGMGC